MVVGDELSQSPTKVRFAQRDDTLQALLLHRADKPFRMRVAVRRTRGVRSTRTDRREPLLYRATPLRIMIADQDPSPPQEGVSLASDRPQALDDEGFVRIRRRAQDLYPSRVQFDHESGVVRHESRKAVEELEERLFRESDVNGRKLTAAESSPIEATDSVH